MTLKFDLIAFTCCIFSLMMITCKGRMTDGNQDSDTSYIPTRKDTLVFVDTFPIEIDELKPAAIYGDTVWINPYGSQEWRDTIRRPKFTVYISVRVDTTDYIIDTVRSKKGDRIVIGYNHKYNLRFIRNNKPWFQLSFDKKHDLKSILEGTDFWLESNLDVFRNLVYNKRYDMFIIEFDINPRYNYGSIYYIIFNTKGRIQYIGISGSWGGGGPDGESFLTENEQMYITCYELFNFSKMKPVSLPEYTLNSDVLQEFESSGVSYKQVHAVRNLRNNMFLVVFNTRYDQPDYNAIILNSDSVVIDRFRYRGLMEEMDAMFLFYSDTLNMRYFIEDTERNMLICIESKDSVYIRQIPESGMLPLPSDSLLPERYQAIDFESFGSKTFYISDSDSTVFFRGGMME